MPSYRTILSIGLLVPGHGPGEVEVAARGAVGATTVLEDFQVDVVAGAPRVTVRFTAGDDAEARQVHERTCAAVRQVARAPRTVLAKVVAGRSVPLV